jgi:hypothetical protein
MISSIGRDRPIIHSSETGSGSQPLSAASGFLDRKETRA